MPIDDNEVTRHRDAVLTYFARRVRDRADAEDLTQETFVRVLRAKDGIRDETKVLPYLYRAARNLLISRARRRNVVMPASAMDEPADLDQVVDSRQDTEAHVRFRELTGRLDMALGRLSHEQRRAFELGVVQRVVYAEIARQTGWSLSKVKVSIHRARKQVISALADFGDGMARSSSNGE